jgi:hypothetical protein
MGLLSSLVSSAASYKLLFMQTLKKRWSSAREEADYYRRKARSAERAAEAAETTEARQFYLELAKSYYVMADDAERDDR